MSSAAETATLSALASLKILSIRNQMARVSFLVDTRLLKPLQEVALIPLSGGGGDTRVAQHLTAVPGLRSGELLSRQTVLGKRGTLLAADGEPLAEGRSLNTPIPDVAGAIAGTLGPIPADKATLYAQEGYPLNATVGVDGLEEIFQRRLTGKLGGKLLAGTRVLRRPHRATAQR